MNIFRSGFPIAGLVVIVAAAVACSKSTPANASPASSSSEALGAKAKAPSVISIQVDENGYTPSSVTVTTAQPLTLRFTRTSDKGCGHKVVVPSRKIEKDLPLNQPVDVHLTPKAGEAIAFACGMGMYKGAVVVAAN